MLAIGMYLAELIYESSLNHSLEISMESMFVWILIFAGAAIALMGVFWIASERELK